MQIVGNSNVCPVCRLSQSKRHDLDVRTSHGRWSNVNLSAERPRASFCVEIVMFVISVSVCEMEIWRDLDLNLQNGPRSKIDKPMERPYETFY